MNLFSKANECVIVNGQYLISSVNACLRKFLGCTSMNFESLQTLLVEIEATKNNWPQTYTYNDEVHDTPGVEHKIIIKIKLRYLI